MIAKPVYIEWVDSQSFYGWQDHSALEGFNETDLVIKTRGYLIKETETRVIVSASVSPTGRVDCPMAIPRCAIVCMEYPE